MKYFFDTEFAETGGRKLPTIDLISIAIVSEDGREFYAESSEFDEANCNDWVKANVLPLLGPPELRLTRVQIRERILGFVGPDPVFWAYYASYDWVVFCWLFGSMMDLPKGWPMMPMDLQQWWIELAKPSSAKPVGPDGQHNALEDARWNRQFFRNMEAYDRSGRP